MRDAKNPQSIWFDVQRSDFVAEIVGYVYSPDLSGTTADLADAPNGESFRQAT